MKEKVPNTCKPISMVYETTDYDLFSFMNHNRETDHVNALIASFRERDVPNAILCNHKLQIVDGQNRFLARKKLGLPILFYCIDDLDIYDVAFLNSYGKNWGTADYVKMWASLGKDDYKKIIEFRNLYPDFSLTSSIQMLQGSLTTLSVGYYSDKNGQSKSKNSPNIKRGTFKIVNWDNAVYIANCAMEYKPFANAGTQIYKQDAFIAALIVLLRNKCFDNAEMVRRASMYRDLFYKCSTKDNYIKMLNELYNYHRKREKVAFTY